VDKHQLQSGVSTEEKLSALETALTIPRCHIVQAGCVACTGNGQTALLQCFSITPVKDLLSLQTEKWKYATSDVSRKHCQKYRAKLGLLVVSSLWIPKKRKVQDPQKP